MLGFAQWLESQIEERGWNKAELARRAALSDSTVSMVMGGQRNPGFEFCVSVAGALELPPENVLRRAGLLPAIPPAAEGEREVVTLFRRLSGELREAALAVLRNLVAIGGERADDEPLDPYRPRTFAERQAYAFAQDIQVLGPEDQRRVYDLMKRLRGDVEASDNVPTVSVDSGP
jgi:transcriptional regulator with XRE-family HTH domain